MVKVTMVRKGGDVRVVGDKWARARVQFTGSLKQDLTKLPMNKEFSADVDVESGSGKKDEQQLLKVKKFYV